VFAEYQQQYYEMMYGRQIRFPDIIGVQTGNVDRPAIIPAELCSIPPGQIFKQKLSEQLMDKARTFATKKPQERLEIIRNGVSKPGQSLLPPVCFVDF
jgi:eukaryotic translation initiation factor 2C